MGLKDPVFSFASFYGALFVISWFFQTEVCSSSRCSRKTVIIIICRERNVPFCCNNSELKDGLCIECSPGFISVDGEPCKKCPIGRYGRKCIKRCSCKRNRCNNVHGCVDINHSSTETSSGGSTEIFKVTTVNSIITSTYNGYSEQIENSTASTYSFIKTSELKSTTSQNSEKRTIGTVKNSNEAKSLNRAKMLIFVYVNKIRKI
ncbi:uncharacterized protein LOC127716148 isoform X5 [Mytilus californianus]|uniref:uncharacterized protein LOC127716148 isoform X5 n=1 Tax=Mytilus californianus TaxID=6549 RepID=UPI002247C334|nr:uncharacterized protein LOC127716148 isoform X5 [Mytilus californianus]